MAETEVQPSAVKSQSAFTKFSDLPTELRLKIWEHASRAPRALELMYCIVDRKFFTFQPAPTVLHTCRESREVGLSNYHLSFGTDKCPPETYFNPTNDTIYFGTRQYDDEISAMVEHFRKQASSLDSRDQIQSLALAAYLWTCDYVGSPFAFARGSRSITRFHESFPHLKELVLVKGQAGEDRQESDLEAKWENYAGVSLVKSTDLLMTSWHDFALEAVISSFESRRYNHPETEFPDVIIMEYGFP
jgi:hypothetical protein